MGDRLLIRGRPLGLAAAALAAVAAVGLAPGTAAAAPEAAPVTAPLAPAECDEGNYLRPVGPMLVNGQDLANRLVGPLFGDRAA